jgi:hypothetical protein
VLPIVTAILFLQRRCVVEARREGIIYSVAIDKELVKSLKELSARKDLSMSHLIREFIRDGLTKNKMRIAHE